MLKQLSHVACRTAICLILLITVSHPVYALTAGSVRNTSYSCYMSVPYEIINIEFSFAGDGSLSADLWEGNGFYVDVMNTFTAFFWAVDAFTISDQDEGTGPMDVNLIVSGTAPGPFIAGAGIMILDYAEIHPVVFVGISTAQPDEGSEWE